MNGSTQLALEELMRDGAYEEEEEEFEEEDEEVEALQPRALPVYGEPDFSQPHPLDGLEYLRRVSSAEGAAKEVRSAEGFITVTGG
ncbi:hypothetical protein CLOM_g2334 [Closterium sp. NIES-68]|nr:hypothetical protein CLOM_g2334 [Closterium sp. NIES-68]